MVSCQRLRVVHFVGKKDEVFIVRPENLIVLRNWTESFECRYILVDPQLVSVLSFTETITLKTTVFCKDY